MRTDQQLRYTGSPMRHFHWVHSRSSASVLLGFLLWGSSCSKGGAGQDTYPTDDLGLRDPSTDGGSERPDLRLATDLQGSVPEGKPEWGMSLHNPDPGGSSVAAGPDGAVYLAGSFSVADFGDGKVTAQGETDCYLTKLDKNGKRMWTKTFGAPFADMSTAVTVDRSGNAVITGYSSGSALGRSESFIASYATDGTQRYLKQFVPLATGQSRAVSATFGDDGTVYATGYFEGSINLGGSDLVSQGSRDIFLVQLSATGTHLFSKSWGRSAVDSPSSLARLPGGDLLMAGRTSGPVNFGDGEKGTPVAGDFIARFSPQGIARWSTRWSVTASSLLAAAAPDGSLWLASDFSKKPIDLGGGPLSSPTGYGLLTAHFSSTGDYLGAFVIPSSQDAYFQSLAVDTAGHVTLGGFANGTIDFGFGSTTQANGTAFFFKQSEAGRVLWAHRFGGTRSDVVQSIAIGADHHVLAAGTLDENIKLGTVSLTPHSFVVSLTP